MDSDDLRGSICRDAGDVVWRSSDGSACDLPESGELRDTNAGLPRLRAGRASFYLRDQLGFLPVMARKTLSSTGTEWVRMLEPVVPLTATFCALPLSAGPDGLADALPEVACCVIRVVVGV